MKYTSLVLMAIGVLGHGVAHAHSGGLDKYGCHNNRATGSYHCHAPAPAPAPAPAIPDIAIKPPPASCSPVTLASVIDGDTVHVRGLSGAIEKVRINQIDAPERSQLYGNEAKVCLTRLVSSGGLQICRDGEDRYGRTIAGLSSYGVDVGQQLVASGCAWAYTKYLEANSPLPQLQAAAMRARLGLWAFDNPMEPAVYRSGTSPVTVNATTKMLAVTVPFSNKASVVNRVLDWAEHAFPDLLVNGGSNQTLADGTQYRCYTTNVCVGHKDGQFLFYDGKTISPIGSELYYLLQAEAAGF